LFTLRAAVRPVDVSVAEQPNQLRHRRPAGGDDLRALFTIHQQFRRFKRRRRGLRRFKRQPDGRAGYPYLSLMTRSPRAVL
jgi:hypothetical protein